MHFSKTSSFSPSYKYFACFSTEDQLLIWETINGTFIDCKFDSSVYSTCTSIRWILTQQNYSSPKKAKISRNYLPETSLLAVGTAKGDIFIYNVTTKNLYLHLVGRHSDSVNDICFYNEGNSLFTCSNDKSIAIWDITSGKQKSKWQADDCPITSICVVDDNNMLSSSSSILWWNISEKCVIKKFNGHSAEIFKLLPVNAVALNSCYILSAAVNDMKINAWSLNSNECQTPVASFVLPDQPEDIDISKVSSKDKPLILATVTKDGFLHLFEHVLNGNINQPIHPKVSIEINSQLLDASIISTKLSPDSESCIVAYGSNKSNMKFKCIKITESLKKSEVHNTALNKDASVDILNVVKETSRKAKGLPINGIKSPSTSENSSKVSRLKVIDSVVSNYRRKLRSSCHIDSFAEPEILNIEETDDSKSKNTKQIHKQRRMKDIDVKDPKSSVEILLKGLQTQDENIIEAVLHNTDTEFISTFVKYLPGSSLKDVLSELNCRLQHHQKYSPALSKWLKEILRVHLNYLIQSQDAVENLGHIKKHLDSLKISETISKLSVLKGFLNLQIQNSSSEESDSEDDKPMEL